MLRFLTAGSVDDGKSTLIGRLLYDSHMIYEDQLNAVFRDSRVHGTTGDDFDPALLTDGLRAEREQGITIDVAYRYFSTEKRSFIICDSPGHEQYTRNMATGASHCDLSLILIDARHGVMPQTRRHSFIATLLGIRHLVVAVNKMDAVDYSEEVYERIRDEYEGFAAKLEVGDVHFMPISALRGDNVVERSANMPWFQGEPLLSYLENVQIASDRNLIDFRFPVQYVLRPDLNFRGFCGTVASGVVRRGDEVVVLPAGRRTRVRSIVCFEGELEEAFAPMATTITTTDEVDISRGSLLCHPNNVPHVGQRLEAMLVWMDDSQALTPNRRFTLKSNTQSVPATVTDLRYKYDIHTFSRVTLENAAGAELSLNDIGRVAVTTHRPLCFDPYSRNRRTGGFILIDPLTNATVACGMISDRLPEDERRRTVVPDQAPVSEDLTDQPSLVTPDERRALLGHGPLTYWFTGLSAAGKSTLARLLEKRLVADGRLAVVLDGENLRQGLNRDLGFTPEDRRENLRRVAEVARLLNDAGLVVIAAFISPLQADRDMARGIVGTDRFREVFVDTPIAVCRERDPHDLYARADAGTVALSGVNAPYEPPAAPDHHVHPHAGAVEDIVSELLREVEG
jgi:bifunctional enzyme CysN/CysC